jgi:hypothetical protein
MPFKSKAQRRKFAELLVTGKISPETYEEWNRETGRAELPERVKPKTKRKRVKTRAERKSARGNAKRKPARRAGAVSRKKRAKAKTTPRRKPVKFGYRIGAAAGDIPSTGGGGLNFLAESNL